MRFARLTSCVMIAAGCLAQNVASPYFGRGIWQGQEVDFRIIDGWAVYQDDIIIGRASDLAARYAAALNPSSEEEKSGRPQSLATADEKRLWPGGVIPYEIDSVFKNTSNVDAAMQHWSSRTSITFVPRTDQTNYVRFTPFQDPSVCASSSIGMAGGLQRIFAAETCPAGALIHEIGHAAGLEHEQARSDRDQYVRILWENLVKPGRSQFGAGSIASNVGPYDYNSIMHYGVGDFGKTGQPGMETMPPGIPIRQNTSLSDGDIDAVNHLYGNAPPAFTISSTPPGLQVTVDGQTITTPMAFPWGPGSTHTVDLAAVQADDRGRYEFARWSDGGDRSHTITVQPDTTIYVANFARYNKFDLRVTPDGAGTVTISPASDDGFYRDGTFLTIAARPNAGYAFANWSGPFIDQNGLSNYGGSAISPYATAELQGLTAKFTLRPPDSGPANPSAKPVTLFTSVLSSGGSAGALIQVDGKQYKTPASFLWDPGSTHDVQVDNSFPNGGDQSLRAFQKWNDDADRVRKVTAPSAAATYTATYQIKYGLGFGWNASGTIAVSPPSADFYYDKDSTVTLTAIATAPAQFIGWSQDFWGRENPFSIQMTETLNGFGFFLPPNVVASIGIADSARNRMNVALSGRTFVGSIAPGESVEIYSPAFGPDAKSDATPDGNGLLPTTLAGVRALFGGGPAPVISAAKGQVTTIVPYGIARQSTVPVQLEYQGARTLSATVNVVKSNPSIYTADGTGQGQALVVNEDGSQNSPDNPAAKGSAVTLFATGLGITAPAVSDLQTMSNPGPAPAGKLEVRISAKVSPILSAGLAPGKAGVQRIQVRVPDSATSGKAAALILTVDGAPSQFDTTIAVQ